MAHSLQVFTVGKTERTWENGGREMKMRSAGRVPRIGFAALAFALAFLACGAAIASDVERQIPVIRDTDGSGLTMEISREGTRQTATPFLTLYEPTVQRIEDRIAKMTARLDGEGDPFRGNRRGRGSPDRPGRNAGNDSGQPQTILSSLPPLPGEITIRNVKSFLKELRASRTEKPAPAVVVAVPEQRLGMAATSPSGAY